MGLYSAFYASLSALGANSSALGVIGNNLANLNTIGYKGSSATFQDIFSASLGGLTSQGNGNPLQIGLGTRLGVVAQNFGQGSFASTQNPLDMAIQGSGFFTVQTKDGRVAFTRAGNFTRDNNGFLVTSDGSQVLGWNRDPTTGLVNTSQTPAAVQIAAGFTTQALATAHFRLGINLNSNQDPTAAAPHLTSPIQLYDSQGNIHTLNIQFTKQAAPPNTWTYTIVDPNGTASFTPAVVTGSLTFNASGNLITPPAGANPSFQVDWNNGTATQTVTWDVRNSDGSSNLTQYASASSTNSSYQDGYGAGSLRDLSVDQNGIISGTFTNGQVLALAQVAIATFANPNGLLQIGNSSWSQTIASGAPTIGIANQGGRGGILGANLELSNVDVAEEFTRLIVSQRGYQASSRVVTATDQLLQETLNLKQ
ncbi:MAG: flagellar hook protein FlgE [Acidobacteria bacterium]|nr:flagellar hook protein FlgE [Acidobacteriota bacterium]